MMLSPLPSVDFAPLRSLALCPGLALGFALALTGALLSPAPAAAQEAGDQDMFVEDAPDAPAVKTATASRGQGMVVAAHPLAVEAGVEILEAGGTAVDAAVAVQTVLSLVEPQSSGLGGGLFALVWDAEKKALQTYDGRETAPAAARPTQFLEPNGERMGFVKAWLGGHSVGVPGAVAALGMMHGDHGALDWSRLLARAEQLATDGFLITPRLHGSIARFQRATKTMPATRAYFFDEEGNVLPVGHRLKNPDYAQTLRLLAEGGAGAFYNGPIAEAIADAVSNAPRNPQAMTVADIARHEAKTRPPLCVPYRAYMVCGMQPPSSGGLVVAQALRFLERFDLGIDLDGAEDPMAAMVPALHLLMEAQRLAYADRDLYVADPDFVQVPIAGMVAPDYTAARSALIKTDASLGVAKAGNPWPHNAPERAPDTSPKMPGTSHFSVADGAGNVVSITTTVEFIFGSHLMAGGFFLNNQLTDFSFEPIKDGRVVANSVQPGKRPRSTMAPTLVFTRDGDKLGEPVFAIGSPGGSRIPGYVLLTLVGVLDWGMELQDAIDLPRALNRNGPVEIEQTGDVDVTAWVEGLKALGHEVGEPRPMGSGLHGILLTEEGLTGGADGRREGVTGVAKAP